MTLSRTVIMVVILMVPGILTGAVIHVPADQPTIQAGIDAASHGDTVMVADGIYTGPGNRSLNFGGKLITVRSENGRQSCIIEVDHPYSTCFVFNHWESPAAVVEGFTITLGYDVYPYGGDGGIKCIDASPTIRNNNIGGFEWVEGSFGAGVTCLDNSAPVIIGNIIGWNHVGGNDYDGGTGGGIICSDSDPIIANNHITGNYVSGSSYNPYGSYGDDAWGGGIYCYDSNPLIINNLITGNSAEGTGGGLMIYHSRPTLLYNTIANNSASVQGGGMYYGFCVTGASTFTNCILWGNSPNSIEYSGPAPAVSYCNVEGGFPGAGNMDADPQFVSGPTGNYCLSHVETGQPADSPCLNAGSDLAENLCHTIGTDTVCMNWKTNRTDQLPDQSMVDLGYHYPWSPFTAQMTCVPGLGTIPFTCDIGVTLDSRSYRYRMVAGHLDVILADGRSYSRLRCGWTPMSPLELFGVHWPTTIPAWQGTTGENVFTLVTEDVTPSPFNHPPASPAGDTATVSCTVTGIAP